MKDSARGGHNTAIDNATAQRVSSQQVIRLAGQPLPTKQPRTTLLPPPTPR